MSLEEFYATIMPFACACDATHPLLEDETIFSQVPVGYVEVMASCLSADPDSRPSMAEVVERLGRGYEDLSELGPACPSKSVESQRFEKLVELLQELRAGMDEVRRDQQGMTLKVGALL